MVEVASSGDAALSMLEQTLYDAMVLDLHMPGMSGEEVLCRARRMYPKLPVVIMTGHASFDSAVVAIKMHAADYLTKPILSGELVEVLTHLMQQRGTQHVQKRLVCTFIQAAESLGRPEPTLMSGQVSGVDSAQILHGQPLTLDRQRRLVIIELDVGETRSATLSEGEAAVLAVFMSFPDQVLSCRRLVQCAWGQTSAETDAGSVIRPIVCRLRGKLEPNPHRPCLILSVRGRGYSLRSASL